MSFIHRAPAGLKLGLSLALILGLAGLPAQRSIWALALLPLLLALAALARLSFAALFARWALGIPFLFAAASLALFQPHGAWVSLGLIAKSAICLLVLQLLASTTSVGELVRTMRRMHVPQLLCETIALLARYASLLSEENRRMGRARASRTLQSSRWQSWRALGNSLGLLFIRTLSRAERVQVAMRSRGGA